MAPLVPCPGSDPAPRAGCPPPQGPIIAATCRLRRETKNPPGRRKCPQDPRPMGLDSGRGDAAQSHGADGVELGLLAGGLLGAFALLVAFVQQLDLLKLLESIVERRLGVVELYLQLVGRTLEVLAPLDRRLGVGRIGEVRRIMDAGAVLFGADFAVEIAGHAVELGDHALDLGHLAPLFVDLKLLQPNERFARLHHSYSSDARSACHRSLPPTDGPLHLLLRQFWADNVSFQFPAPLGFAAVAHTHLQDWLILPYLERGTPQAARAA